MTDYRKISMDGLWNNNPATVQILGLCPLLAVSGTVVNAMGLGWQPCWCWLAPTYRCL
jgi:Na+-translocating ferredoxin:NAD+ oxidoreductase subunit E